MYIGLRAWKQSFDLFLPWPGEWTAHLGGQNNLNFMPGVFYCQLDLLQSPSCHRIAPGPTFGHRQCCVGLE